MRACTAMRSGCAMSSSTARPSFGMASSPAPILAASCAPAKTPSPSRSSGAQEKRMNIVELGYLLVGAPDVAAWRTFGTEVIGAMAVSGPAGALYLKIDPRAFRIAVLPGRPAGLVASGWLVASQRDFDEARDALQGEEVVIQRGDADGAELRKVQDYFSFEDPAGHLHEIAWGPISDFTPFV